MNNVTRCRLMVWGQSFNVFPEETASFVIVAMLSIINVFIVMANLAAISTFAYARCAAHRKHNDWVKVENSITKILMGSLVISDAIFGITGLPLIVFELHHNGRWTLGPTWCFVKVLAHYLWGPLVMFHVVCMAVDRFLAVCKPLVYRHLSFKVGYGLVGLCWTLSLILVFTPMTAKWFDFVEEFQPCSEFSRVCDIRRSRIFVILNYLLVGFLPISAILVLYFCIFRCILRSGSRIANSSHKQRHQSKFDGKKNKTNLESETIVEKNLELDHVGNPDKIIFQIFQNRFFIDASSSTSGIDTQVNNFVFSENKWNTALSPSLQISGDKTSLKYNNKSKFEAVANATSQNPSSDAVPDCLEKSLSQEKHLGLPNEKIVLTSAVPEETSKTFRFSIRRGATLKSKLRDRNISVTREQSRGLRKMRAVRTIGLLVLCFSISWLPVFISVPIFTMNKTQMPSWLILFILFCNYSNAALDPVLFCCNRHVRHIIQVMMVRMFGRFRQTKSDGTSFIR